MNNPRIIPDDVPQTSCAHCGRLTGNFEGGYAWVGIDQVCHPNEAGRPDCFRMITVYGHGTRSCERCTEQPWEPLTKDEIVASMVSSIAQLQEMVNDIYPLGILPELR